MKNWKRYIPDGTRDILFEECSTKIKIENSLRKTYITGGFEEIISPTLEFYDVFDNDNVAIEQEEMYKLFDSNGRILALKPDMTTPIARIVATKLKDAVYPLRLCYTSNIFRVNRNFEGKLSETTQSGIEIIGSNSLKADAEVVITGINALLESGLKDFKIDLGQAEFFKSLVQDTQLNKEDLEKLRKLIENKNITALSEFLENKKYNMNEENLKILKKLPELFGGIEVIDEAKLLTKNEKALKSLEKIKEVYKILESIGLSTFISIDLGMVHHINYYTGVIFKGYSSGVGKDILKGGRYDRLIEEFGLKIPATGLAINVDSILEGIKNQRGLDKLSLDFIIYYQDEFFYEAYKLSKIIKKNKYTVELSLYKKEEECLNYAKLKGIKYMISINNKNKAKIVKVLNNNEGNMDKEKLNFENEGWRLEYDKQ